MKLEQLIRQQVDMCKEMADLNKQKFADSDDFASCVRFAAYFSAYSVVANELLKALQDAEDVPTYKKPAGAGTPASLQRDDGLNPHHPEE
nr:MAG TPA: hypothetical protein [Caudoviricetes sp.]